MSNILNFRLKHYIVNADFEKSQDVEQNGTEHGDTETCHISSCEMPRPGSPDSAKMTRSEAEADSAMSQVRKVQYNGLSHVRSISEIRTGTWAYNFHHPLNKTPWTSFFVFTGWRKR